MKNKGKKTKIILLVIKKSCRTKIIYSRRIYQPNEDDFIF